MTSDVWICGSCRTVNTHRSGQCYGCHAWRNAVAVAPADISTLGSVISGQGHAPAPIGHRYRSARLRAFVASLLIIGVAVMLPVIWWYTYRGFGAIADGDDELAKSILNEERPIIIAFWGIAAAALVLWAAWVSRVVDNLPALGVGYSRATPQMAFFENLVPGFNLFRLPVRVREVTRLLHPLGEGDGLIAIAWLVMIAGWVVLFFGRFVLIGQVLEGHEADVYPTLSLLLAVTYGCTSIGLLIVVGVIRRVEGLAAARARGLAPAASTAAMPPLPAPPATAITDRTAGTPTQEPSWRLEPASSFAAGRTVGFLAERAAAAAPRAGSAADDWDEVGPGQPASNGETSPHAPQSQT